MATGYVDAGHAVDAVDLTKTPRKAPEVTKGVTYDRIRNAREEPHNWLTYYGAYDGQRYSPLDQINTSNVGKLKPEWVYQIGSMGMHSGASTYAWEASPIIVDGLMFVPFRTAERPDDGRPLGLVNGGSLRGDPASHGPSAARVLQACAGGGGTAFFQR
jgi:hypothetical protein